MYSCIVIGLLINRYILNRGLFCKINYYTYLFIICYRFIFSILQVYFDIQYTKNELKSKYNKTITDELAIYACDKPCSCAITHESDRRCNLGVSMWAEANIVANSKIIKYDVYMRRNQ